MDTIQPRSRDFQTLCIFEAWTCPASSRGVERKRLEVARYQILQHLVIEWEVGVDANLLCQSLDFFWLSLV